MAIKTNWDLSPLLKSEKDAERQISEVKKENECFVKKWQNRNDYPKDPKLLKEALDDLENLEKNYGNSGGVGYYYNLKFYENQSDASIKAKLNKIEEIERNNANNLKFFTLNIAKIPKEEQNRFLNYAPLKDYKHFLEMLFASAKHHLSEKEEKILSLKRPVSHDFWERMTLGLLAKQERKIKIKKDETKSFSQLLSLTENKDKEIRAKAAKEIDGILEKYSEVAETEINAIITNKKIEDELRNFQRPDSSRHLEDDISTEIVDCLIKTVSENYKISHRFYKLKAALLKVPKLKYYERATSYEKKTPNYPFNKAVTLAKKTFSNLDKQFLQIFEEFLENGKIDAFPKKGKANGAFCMHVLKTQPTYILLNHDDSLKDVTTIAHEVGHGINNELMKLKQNALNFETPKSTAEVASTFMEDFVLEELLKEADDEEKLAIIVQKLNGDISTIFRQTAFYKFEFELHNLCRKKGYISKEEIGELFKKHMSSYMGPSVDTSNCQNWWIYVEHFRYLFYVYSYASGLLISKALQAQVKKDPKSIIQVKEFLSAGSSDSPENIFKKLGIDITQKKFWLSGIKETENMLKQAETLAKKLKKL